MAIPILDVASILGARRVAFSTSRYPLSPSLSSAIVTIGGGFFKLGETQRVSGKGTIDWNGRGERGQSTASIGTNLRNLWYGFVGKGTINKVDWNEGSTTSTQLEQIYSEEATSSELTG